MFAGAVLSVIIYHILEGKILTLLLKENDHIKLSEGIFCSCQMAFYKTLTFGSGTMPSGVYFLYKRCGIEIADAVQVLLIQMAAQKTALVIISWIGFFFCNSFLERYWRQYKQLIWTACIVSLLLSAVIFLISFNLVIVKEFLKIFRRVHIALKDKKYSRPRKEELIMIMELEVLKLFCIYSLPFFILKHKKISLPEMITITALAFVLAGIFPSPGGFGTTEGSFFLLFSRIISYKETAEIIFLYRVFTIAVPFVMKCFFTLREVKKEDKKETPV